MNITLSPKLEKLVEEQVASGAYESAEAVIAEALRLFYEQEQMGRSPRPSPFWTTATPEDRARAFAQWASRHRGGPGLPADALRRENMYD
jgi:Arc/MetJ-type ribon-helix-helix transcriptional regulator